MASLKDKIDNLSQKWSKLSDKVNAFGPKTAVEMPGGGESQNEDPIEMLDFIIGSLAHIFCGEKNITHENIKQHLNKNKDKTIFGRIDNINKVILKYDPDSQKFGARVAAVSDIFLKKITRDKDLFDNQHKAFKTIDVGREKYLDKLSKKLKTITFNVQGIDDLIDEQDNVEEAIEHNGTKTAENGANIQINIDSHNIYLEDIETKLKSIFESMNNISGTLEERLSKNFLNFTEIIKTLNSTLTEIGGINEGKITDDLTALCKIIDAMDKDAQDKKNGSLGKILKGLKDLGDFSKQYPIDASLKELFSITSELTKTLKNIQETNYNNIRKNIDTLTSIIGGKDSSIHKLLNAIKELNLGEGSSDVKNSLEALKSFMGVITNILDVSPLKVIKAKISVLLIRHLLVDSIKDIISDLKDTEKIINGQEVQHSFAVFNAFIDSVVKLAEVDIKNRRKMHSNLKYIKRYILEDIQKLILEIKKIEPMTEGGMKSLEAFGELLDTLLKVSEIKKDTFRKMSLNIDYLQDIAENELPEFLQSLGTKKLFGNYNPEKIVDNVKSAKEIIDTYSSIFENIGGFMKHIKDQMKLDMIISEIDSLIIMTSMLHDKAFNKTTLKSIKESTLPSLKEIFDKFDEMTNSIVKIDPTAYDNLDAIINFINKLDALSKLESLGKIADIGTKALGPAIDTMITIISKFNEVDEESIEKANDTIDALMKIVIGSATILLIGGLVMTFIKVSDIIAFTVTLSIFLFAVTGVFKLISKSLKDSMEGAKDAVILIAGAGFVLLLGGYLAQYIDLKSLIKFTFMLTLFLFGVSAVFYLFHEGFENAMYGAQDAVILIGGAAAILLLGSLLVGIIDFGNAMKFTAMLGIFLLTMSVIFYFFHEGFEDAMEGAKDAIILIGGAALILILGSLIVPLLNWKNVLLFILYLGGFLAVIGLIFTVFEKGFKAVAQGAKDAIILIGVSAFILILGSYIMQYIDTKALLQFAFILVAFVGGIMLFFGLAQMIAKGALKGTSEVAILVGVSAAILIIGAWLIQKEIIDPAALGIFALILGLFVSGIIFVFSRASKRIKNCLPGLIGIALITLVAGGILILAAKVMSDHPGMEWKVGLFGLILIAYIGAMGTLAALLGNPTFKKYIYAGVGIMGAIILITGLAVIVIKKLAEVGGTKGFFDNLLTGVGGMFVVIGSVVTAAGALGAIAFAGGGLGAGILAAGAAVIVAVIEIVNLAAGALNAIADAIIKLKSVEDFDADKLIGKVKAFAEIAEALTPIGKKWFTIEKASWAISSLNHTLATMAKTIQQWADLRMPVYEGTKIVGYETIKSDAFGKAAENIKLVATTLSQAIVDVYDEKPELFDFDFFSGVFGQGGTKFARVAKSLKSLGPMLSSIAKGIRTWTNLRIPEYTGAKVSGYITITKSDFPKAAENIKDVIITMAQAVIDAYDEKPELFDSYDDGWLGTGIGAKSKFSKIAKSLGNMGPMLTSIAKGIKTWADLKIPTYKGKEISGYTTLTSGDFVKAGEHIKEVITIMSEALIEAYDDNPELFTIEDDIWGIGGSTKFSKIAKSIGKMGSMLQSIGSALKTWADLKIPVYKPNSTEIQTYISLTSNDFEKVGQHINEVVTCLASGIIAAYENNEEIFDDTWFTDSPFTKVCKSFGKMGPMLKDIATAIQTWADLKVPVYKNGSTEIKSYVSLTEDDFAKVGQNINKVITTLANGIIATYEQNTDMFSDLWLTDSPFTKVVKSFVPMGNMLKDIATAIQTWADLKIPIYKEGSTEIESYVSLDKDDFKKVNDNIGLVVSALAQSVLDIYKKKENTGMFDGKGWFGLGKSDFAKVTNALVPMGNMLKNIASAVKDWSKLQIPVYDGVDEKGNPKVVKYITIDKKEFEDVGKNIGKVVTCLAEAIGQLYKDHKEYFDSSGWLGMGDSPIARVAKSLTPMGNMLESVANGIKFWAELKIPKYEGTKIVGYTTIGDKEFENATVNIERVVTQLGNAIISVVDAHPELFSSDEKANGVVKASEAIKIGGDALASIARTLGNYASGKFPVLKLNDKGQWVTAEMIKLDGSKLQNIEKNVDAVICALGRAIVNVYEKNKDSGIFLETVDRGFLDMNDPVIKQSPIAIVANSISITAKALNDILDIIGKIVELKTDNIVNQLGDVGQDGTIVNDFDLIISKFFALAHIIADEKANHTWLGYDNGVLMSYHATIKYLQERADAGAKLPEKITLIKSTYEKVLGKAADISKAYEKYKTDIEKFLITNNDKVSIIIDQFRKVIEVFLGISDTLYDNKSSYRQLEFISNNADDIKEHIGNITRVLTNMFKNIIKINKNFEKVGTIKVDEIKQSIRDIKSIIDEFDNLVDVNAGVQQDVENSLKIGGLSLLSMSTSSTTGKNIKTLEDEYNLIKKKMNLIVNISKKTIQLGELQSSFSVDAYKDIFFGITLLYKGVQGAENVSLMNIEKLKDIRKTIRKIIFDVQDTPPLELFKILATGLEYIYTVTSKIQSVSNFKSHTEWLQKYVRAVNQLNNVNITSLIQFVEAVDHLSQRLGDLDKLTEAIGDKLSSVLCELVNQLRKADASITNAHQLQEKRKQLIQESLDKVKNIMNQHMIVEISQTSSVEGGEGGLGGSSTSSGGGESNSNGGPTSVLSTTNNGNPENVQPASTAPGGGSTIDEGKTTDHQNWRDPDVHKGFSKLDLDEFRRLCKMTFASTVLKNS
jgi:hypothetical protein